VLQIPEPPFSYYRVAGSERLEWLQGQLTQDVLSIRPGEWKRAAVLSATGQLLSDGALWVYEDHCILGLDRLADGVGGLLSSRIIMEDVVFSMIDDPVSSFLGEPPSEFEGTALRIDHVGEPGFDIIGT
jgi:glycine cleavage system aminomethyltransferase T